MVFQDFELKFSLWSLSGVKNFNCRIDSDLDIRLTLYAVYLRTTKARAGALAMAQGVPAWVMALPPSEAQALAMASSDDALGDSPVADPGRAVDGNAGT